MRNFGRAVLVMAFLGLPAALAAEKTFPVPTDDGYGMDDCLLEGQACAKLVADSWCQVKGMSQAVRFERAAPEDITASLAHEKTAARSATTYLITCQD